MDQEVTFTKVDHIYEPNSPLAKLALSDISLTIDRGSFTAIIGHTGSGKSTLVQHINALIKPTTGTITVAGFEITNETSNKNLKQLRENVGMVFQFPEKQLFDETVIKDVMFGPLNYGKTDDEARQAASSALNLVKIGEQYYEKSPFDLSGGQMRRVAIAGVLAMKPEILILDEPTAGLDPQGHQEIMELVQELNREQNVTIILVTHQMEDVVESANQVVVMESGKIVKDGTVREIFNNPQWLADKQLSLPKAADFASKLGLFGHNEELPLTVDELAKAIAGKLREDQTDE